MYSKNGEINRSGGLYIRVHASARAGKRISAPAPLRIRAETAKSFSFSTASTISGSNVSTLPRSHTLAYARRRVRSGRRTIPHPPSHTRIRIPKRGYTHPNFRACFPFGKRCMKLVVKILDFGVSLPYVCAMFNPENFSPMQPYIPTPDYTDITCEALQATKAGLETTLRACALRGSALMAVLTVLIQIDEELAFRAKA